MVSDGQSNKKREDKGRSNQRGLDHRVNKSKRSMKATGEDSSLVRKKAKNGLGQGNTKEVNKHKEIKVIDSTKSNVTPVTATFEEEGDMIELEVPGQSTDFVNEDNQEDLDEVDSEFDGEEVHDEVNEASKNNNAAVMNVGNAGSSAEGCRSRNQTKDRDEFCRLARRDPKELKWQEESEMMKFVEFMKKQGLVMMHQPEKTGTTNKIHQMMASSNQTSQKKDRRGIEPDFVDNSSVITVYQNAVEPAVTEGRKRDSSSSEEPLDASDEIDKTLGVLSDNVEQNIDAFISDDRNAANEMQRVSLVDHGRITVGDVQPHTLQITAGRLTNTASPARPQLTKAEEMIRDVEAVKARIVDVPGGLPNNLSNLHSSALPQERIYLQGF